MNLAHFEDIAIVPCGAVVADKTHPFADGWRIIRSIAPQAPDGRLLIGKLGRTYRGYTISYDPPPIPIRTMDWQFTHRDYDGGYYDAEGSVCEGDRRHGYARTLDACFDEIDAIEDQDSDDIEAVLAARTLVQP